MLTYGNYSSQRNISYLKKLYFSACLINENDIADTHFPKDLQKLRLF